MACRRLVYLLPLLVFSMLFLGVSYGSTGFHPLGALRCFCGSCSLILWLRLLRTLQAIVVGCLLAVAGCILQSVTGNVLAEPSILGLSSTGLLAVGLAVLASPLLVYNVYLLSLVSFAGCLLGYALTLLVAEAAGGGQSSLILAGIAVTAFTTGVAEVVGFMVQYRLREPFFMLLLGSYAYTSLSDLVASSVMACILALVLPWLVKPLNALQYGDEYAYQLGYSPRLVRRVAASLAALAVGVTVASSGIIGFIGLIAPNIARSLTGSGDNRRLLPVSILVGGALSCSADIACRFISAVTPYGELPVGVLTAVIGGVFFAYLLVRQYGGRGGF